MLRVFCAAVIAGFVFQAAAQPGLPTKLFKSYTFDAPLATFSGSVLDVDMNFHKPLIVWA